MTLPTFFLDFETTGLDPRIDEVVEVGLLGPRAYQALVGDARPSTAQALAVHGLSTEICQRYGQPGEEVLEGLLERLGPAPLRIVAHHAAFEQAFLEAWAQRCQRTLPPIQWVCTLAMASELVPERFGLSLRNLAQTFGWRASEHHRADEDATLAARLWEQLPRWREVQAALGPQPGLVYLAGPLRGDGSSPAMEANRLAMARLAAWVQALLPGAHLVIPHLNFAYLDESGPGGLEVRERILTACEALVRRCDALILCGPTLTQGMAREVGVAKEGGVRILQAPGWDAPPHVHRNAHLNPETCLETSRRTGGVNPQRSGSLSLR